MIFAGRKILFRGRKILFHGRWNVVPRLLERFHKKQQMLW